MSLLRFIDRHIRELKAHSERQIWNDDQRTETKTKKKRPTVQSGSRFSCFRSNHMKIISVSIWIL